MRITATTLLVNDLRHAAPAVFAQLDRLSRLTDKIYVHIEMDVLDPREVMGHQNKVANGPAIGFATIPAADEGGRSLAAVNRMIAGAVRGLSAREMSRPKEPER